MPTLSVPDMSTSDPKVALPWLRVSLVIRRILGTAWDDETWPAAKTELTKALALRSRIARSGWFD